MGSSGPLPGEWLSDRHDVVLLRRWEVVGEQTPRLLGCQPHCRSCWPRFFAGEPPPMAVIDEMPRTGDWALYEVVDGLVYLDWHRAEMVRIRRAQSVEDRYGIVGPEVARAAKGMEDLLAVNPQLGEFAQLVQPDRNRTRACL